MGKKECSFLKKRTKKLSTRCRGLTGSAGHKGKSFLVLFFKKEQFLPFL
jgi:hypothetical protein